MCYCWAYGYTKGLLQVILLFGGTSETAKIATLLTQTGHAVLVSTATDANLDVGDHPAIHRRCGRLDIVGILELIVQNSVHTIVDGSHPYATQLHETVASAAQQAGIPCFRYQRNATIVEDGKMFFVDSHEEAAKLAVSFGVPILLTTGSRNLSPYIKKVQEHNIPLYARVLPHAESRYACVQAGLPEANQIIGRGPFSQMENCTLIRNKEIGVLITKDSGVRGGVKEKISAAHQENCRIIVIRRPSEENHHSSAYKNIHSLIAAVKTVLQTTSD